MCVLAVGGRVSRAIHDPGAFTNTDGGLATGMATRCAICRSVALHCCGTVAESRLYCIWTPGFQIPILDNIGLASCVVVEILLVI